MTQISFFDGENKFKIDKPIRLIELFAGYGSQHLALKYLGAECESYHICEWAVKSIQAYKDIHFGNDNTDYSKDLSFDDIVEFLCNKGISANYNDLMNYDQIKRMGEVKCRQTYNNIKATHNLVNIMQTKADDLEIIDTDKYCYLMTYSFPCQDLSKAGKGKGMEKGSGTRSGMLWEVERILEECTELPQVLLMENVPDVIGSKNAKHFAQWVEKLQELGYKNYWQILNGKDYGIPQNRQRCFMVSILGDYYYEFPKTISLKLMLKDMLEDEVDDKYYLSDEQILTAGYFGNAVNPNLKDVYDRKKAIINKQIAYTVSTKPDRRVGDCNYVTDDRREMTAEEFLKPIKVKEATRKGYAEAYESDSINLEQLNSKTRRGRVGKGVAQTLTTSCNQAAVKNSRIRKLTPKECWRLMGVKDEDYEKAAKNQSNSSLYHLAGDSIITNVLMAIFNEMM